MPMHDSSGRPIPPPPARFSPTARNTSRIRLRWNGDTRGDQRPEYRTPGNITARTNRQPLTAGLIRHLMAAPTGR